MGTGDTTMGGADMPRGFAPGEWASAPWRRSYRGSRWTMLEIAAMVFGFMICWPIGLAILAYMFWQRRTGRARSADGRQRQMGRSAQRDGLGTVGEPQRVLRLGRVRLAPPRRFLL